MGGRAGWAEQGRNAPKVGGTLAGGAGPRQGAAAAESLVLEGKGAGPLKVWRDKCKKLTILRNFH